MNAKLLHTRVIISVQVEWCIKEHVGHCDTHHHVVWFSACIFQMLYHQYLVILVRAQLQNMFVMTTCTSYNFA